MALTEEQHRDRHKLLHQMFDELFADFLAHNRGKLPSSTTALELIEWSHQQTIKPSQEGA